MVETITQRLHRLRKPTETMTECVARLRTEESLDLARTMGEEIGKKVQEEIVKSAEVIEEKVEKPKKPRKPRKKKEEKKEK